ncbi:MAG: hypothetical protein WCN95_16665, partial [bacterium]
KYLSLIAMGRTVPVSRGYGGCTRSQLHPLEMAVEIRQVEIRPCTFTSIQSSSSACDGWSVAVAAIVMNKET